MSRCLPTRATPRLAALSLVLALAIALGAIAGSPGAFAQDATPIASPAATPLAATIERQAFSVAFGDFEADAELTYPADETGPFPTVILIPGSGPADMDFTVRDPATGAVRSTNFRDIAEHLSARGYAVARYNKRFVGGPNDFEGMQAYYQNFTFEMLREDAGTVYETVRGLPQVDPKRIALYGWSEGSTVAVQLAIAEPAIAAVILQGPVDGTFRDLFAHQNQKLAVEFLRTVADTDQDGLVSAEDVFAAYGQQPGTVGSFAILITLDLASLGGGQPSLSPVVDQNEDGLIDIDGELVPQLEEFFANFDELSAAGQSPYGPQYATDQQLPTILESVDELQQPVLILQGENDANVPPAAAERIDAALAEAGHPDHTLIIYPGLGHSLGTAPTLFADNFTPITEAPLDDLVAWLDAHLGG